MNTSDMIRRLCEKQNVSVSELARRIGQSRRNLYKKLRQDTLTIEELRQIADALGVNFAQTFTLPSGEQLRMENAPENSEQIRRIEEMEQILDRANAAIDALPESGSVLQEMEPEIQKLIAYYASDLWRQDFEDDADGKLPKDLKRGVLSEDGVYDLLMRLREM